MEAALQALKKAGQWTGCTLLKGPWVLLLSASFAGARHASNEGSALREGGADVAAPLLWGPGTGYAPCPPPRAPPTLRAAAVGSQREPDGVCAGRNGRHCRGCWGSDCSSDVALSRRRQQLPQRLALLHVSMFGGRPPTCGGMRH